MHTGIQGFIFDLDGTLVDSGLDFDAMRQDMGLAQGVPVLEEIERMEKGEAERCRRILECHELEGARNCSTIPGVCDFLRHLDNANIPRAVITRNSRAMAQMALARCDLQFEHVVTREDGPVKPDPWAIHHICRHWRVTPESVVMLGDFRYDIEAGRAAGTKTVFLGRGRNSKNPIAAISADFVLRSFEQMENISDQLGLKRQYSVAHRHPS